MKHKTLELPTHHRSWFWFLMDTLRVAPRWRNCLILPDVLLLCNCVITTCHKKQQSDNDTNTSLQLISICSRLPWNKYPMSRCETCLLFALVDIKTGGSLSLITLPCTATLRDFSELPAFPSAATYVWYIQTPENIKIRGLVCHLGVFYGATDNLPNSRHTFWQSK